MAARVSSDHFDVLPATTKRALGYLRWYPSAWRERYGEEFVAHLAYSDVVAQSFRSC